MTKLRPPMSFERALTRIADQLGWDGCAAVIGTSESYVRKLSDPDIEREISMRAARRLDAAYRRAGGSGAPMLECYALQLDIDMPPSTASPDALIEAVGQSAREHGEAVVAALEAIKNVGCPSRHDTALREIEQAIDALSTLAAQLGATKPHRVGG